MLGSAKNTMYRALRPYYVKSVALASSARIKYGPLPSPRELTLDPTYHCNLDCISCKCTQIAPEFPRERELTPAEYKDLFVQFKALGGTSVSIYGGEPLLAKDLPATVQAATVLGLTTRLATNGLLLNEERVAALAEAGLDLLSISVDGTGTTYNEIAGRERFEQLRVSLQTFKEVRTKRYPKLKTCIHATVMRQNAECLTDILDLAHEMSISTVFFNYVSRVPLDADKKTEAMLGVTFLQAWNHWDIDEKVLVTEDQIPALVAQVAELKRKARRLDLAVSIDPALDGRFNAEDLINGSFSNSLPCTVPWGCIFVGPLGDLAPCMMLTHHPVANVREVRLADYWADNQGLAQLRGMLRQGRYLPICANCCGHQAMMP